MINLILEIEKQTNIRGSKIALNFDGDTITYKQLNIDANKIAYEIRKLSFAIQQPVLALFGNNLNSSKGLLGVLKARAILVPLSPKSPLQYLLDRIKVVSPSVLLVDKQTLKLGRSISKHYPITIINIEALPKNSGDNLGLKYSPEDSLLISYTSGSTGKQIGVLIDHRLYIYLFNLSTNVQLDHRDRWLTISHFSHLNGASMPLQILAKGGTGFYFNFQKYGFSKFAKFIQSEKISYLHFIPTVYRHFIRSLTPEDNFPHVRIVHLGGESVFSTDFEMYKRVFSDDCLFINNIGATEAGAFSRYIVNRKSKVADGVFPIGNPPIDGRIELVDKNGGLVDDGEIGEMKLISKYISKGFFRDEEKTKKVFKPHTDPNYRIFLTGDLAYRNKDGNLMYVGRKDFQIKIRGVRINPADIEAELVNIPDIEEAVVKAFPDKNEDFQLVGYYLSKGRKIEKAEIVLALQNILPAVMIPKSFTRMEKWPLLISGKIDRKNLPIIESLTKKSSSEKNENFAKTAIELRLAKLWEQNLFIKNIDVDRDYFEMGGDSLSAVSLFLDIEREFKINLPISILLLGSTIREQANILSKGEKEFYWDTLIPVQIRGNLPPIFCIAGYGGNPLSFRTFSEYFGKDQPIYFLQSKGLNGVSVLDETIEEIAKNFLAEIKKVMPIGPYRFVGQSMGGKVAYEIAQQLSREGKTVDLLVLLDTYGNNYLQGYNRDEDFVGNLKRLLRIGNKHFYNLRKLKFPQYYKYFKYYFDAIPHNFRRLKEKIFNLQRSKNHTKKKSVALSNLMASKNYIAEDYGGNVLLFRAENQPPNVSDDKSLGWGEVVKGSLEIINIAGYHGGMLFEPWVGKIVNPIAEKIASLSPYFF